MIKKPSTFMEAVGNAAKIQKKQLVDGTIDSISTVASIVSKMVEEKQTVDSINGLMSSIQTTYYNKFTSNDKIYEKEYAPEGSNLFLDEDIYYVTVAHSQPRGKINEININGEVFTKENRIKQLSIGKNAFIIANIWKINENDDLVVAVPWLCALADTSTGITPIVVNGLMFEVSVMNPLDFGNELKITNAVVTEKTGYPNTATINGNMIDVQVGYKTQAVCVTLSSGETGILDTSLMLFSITNDMDMVITTPEVLGGNSCTYSLYVLGYKEEAVTEYIEKKYVKTLFVPGYGVIEFTINVTGIPVA